MPPLLRTLRLTDLLLLFIGSVIGSGIFLTPGLILQRVDGSVGLSLLVWVFGGILSLLGALTYAELAAANPEAGGLYCYIRDGFGRAPAFLYGWCLFLVIASGTIAALAHAFTRYLAEIIPLSPIAINIVAVVMIAVVTAVNVWGTRKSSDLQNWTTLAKAGIVVILSAVLLSLGHHYSDLAPALGTSQRGFSLASNFGLAMIAVLWAYEGWQFGTYSAGEVVKPQRAFPKAFLLGSVFLMALYVIANTTPRSWNVPTYAGRWPSGSSSTRRWRYALRPARVAKQPDPHPLPGEPPRLLDREPGLARSRTAADLDTVQQPDVVEDAGPGRW